MEKRGKIPVWAIVLIVLAVFILFVLVAMLIMSALGYYLFSSYLAVPPRAIVDPPFYVNSWNAETTGVSLELINNGGQSYVIKSLEVLGCGKTLPQEVISAGEAKTFKVECSLTKGEVFKGNIKIIYSKEGSAVEFDSLGSMVDTIV